MGKYHNLLYVAIKLAFDWSLQDNHAVAALLDELYACEGTFERIFLGMTILYTNSKNDVKFKAIMN